MADGLVNKTPISGAADKKTYQARPKWTPEQLDAQLNNAIIHQQWADIDSGIRYAQTWEYEDTVTLQYARAVMFRHQKNYEAAVAAYREILADHPDRTEMRLELAIMLFQNEQYEAAQDQFYKVSAQDIPAATRKLIDHYLLLIQKSEVWGYDVNVNLLQMASLNDPSDERRLRFGQTSHRHTKTWPTSVLGVGYGLGINKDFALADHHAITTAAYMTGRHYFQEDADQQQLTLRLSSGYQYQTLRSWVTVTPFTESTLVNHTPYRHNAGIVFEYGQWISHRAQVVSYYKLTKKTYTRNEWSYLAGHSHDMGTMYFFLAAPTLRFFTGGHFTADLLQYDSESSRRYGLQSGLMKEWSWGVSSQISLTYERRNFAGRHFVLTDKTRHDNTYIALIELWHRNIYFFGITPRLNYMYQRIDSNIPDRYGRKEHQLFLSFEKTF